MDENPEPEREGYVYLGSVAVESGALMLADPSLVLRETETEESKAAAESLRASGVDMDNLVPTYEEVLDAVGYGYVGRVRDSTALVFPAGYGDGEYPVFGKMNEDGRIIEVVIEMGITSFQKAVLER